MKIAYLSSVRIPSEKASGLAIVRQCQAFASNGHQVELFIPKRAENESETINEVYGFTPNFDVKYFPAKAIYNFGKLGFFLMLIRDSVKLLKYYFKNKNKPDVIYSRDHRLLFLFILFGLQEKCFVEMHTKHDDFITKFVLKRAEKVIVISEGLADFYSKLTNRTNLQVEPSGVYLKQFENLPETNVSRETLALPKNKKIFAYIGKYKTMGETKGVDEIIIAFAKLVKNNHDVLLYLVGIEDDERVEVNQLCKANGLVAGENIIISKLDQAKFAEYLNASDILLMNYPDTEHYAKYMSPTKLFAYMAVGKPFISTRLDSITSFTEARVVYINPGDDYSEALQNALSNYETLAQSAKLNKNTVKQYCWKERAKKIL